MKLVSCKGWISVVIALMWEAVMGSPSLAQTLEAHTATRAPLSESTAMLMFGVSLVLIGGILHRRAKTTRNRAMYRSSGQLSVRLNDR